MLLELVECGFGFADAYSKLMTTSAMIEDASCDHENRGLVRDGCVERINFKDVFGLLTSE